MDLAELILSYHRELITSLLSIVLYLLSKRSVPRAKVFYHHSSETNVDTSTLIKFKNIYEGCTEKMNLRSHWVCVWNGGSRALPRRDLVNECGLQISFPAESRIDGVTVVYHTDEYDGLEFVEDSPNQLRLSWTNLNPEEGFIFTFVSCSPQDSNPSFDARYVNSTPPSNKDISARFAATRIKFGWLWNLPLNPVILKVIESFWNVLGIGVSVFMISSLVFNTPDSPKQIIQGLVGTLLLTWMLYRSMSWRTPYRLIRFLKKEYPID